MLRVAQEWQDRVTQGVTVWTGGRWTTPEGGGATEGRRAIEELHVTSGRPTGARGELPSSVRARSVQGRFCFNTV